MSEAERPELLWRRWFGNEQGPGTTECDRVSQSVRAGGVFVVVLKKQAEILCGKDVVHLTTDCVDRVRRDQARGKSNPAKRNRAAIIGYLPLIVTDQAQLQQLSLIFLEW